MTNLLLVTDTSGKNGFVGLVRADDSTGQRAIEVVEEVPLAGGTFSAQLVPQISGLLENHGFKKTDIDAFVVISGPGSFTGLRVGLAAIKALAEILQKPIVAVSLLEVLARNSNLVAAGKAESSASSFPYAVALDAGRSEAYVGQYEIAVTDKTNGSFRCAQESLLSLELLAGLVESKAANWIATSDAVVSDYLNTKADIKSHVVRTTRPRSQEIASVGWRKLKSGETVSPERLDANYIRRSDAEIFAKPSR